MHTIVVHKQKRRSRSPSPQNNDPGNPDTVTLEMEVVDMPMEYENKALQSISKSENYAEKPNIPPYVIWVQLMRYGGDNGYVGEGEPIDYEPQTRNSFVRKVFTIVFIMILVTALICVMFHVWEPAQDFFLRFALFILFPAIIVQVGINYAMACSPCARQFPINYILLTLLTISSSMVCTYMTLRMRTLVVMCVLGATGIVVFICVLLALSSFDFTKYMLYIVMIAAAMGAIGFIFFIVRIVFKVHMKPLHLVILGVSTLVTVVVFAMELQMILGGRTVELGVDEYAIAAMMVYMSILDIFLKLLHMARLLDD